MQTISFISLGCPKNQVDSEIMLGMLTREGFVVTNDPARADIIIVNTCAFIADAKTESVDTILEMAAYRRNGPCKLLVVTGCLPQRYRDELASSMPEVDLFIGVGELLELPALIRSHSGVQRIEVGRPRFPYDHDTPRMRIGRPHAAYVKIAEGCFHPCSFCIIPHIRGRYRSRPMESIVEEVRRLLDEGVREVNLIAQDTTAYGSDFKERVDLGGLLERLASLEGDKWIRILYGYPHDFPDSVISAMRDCKGIAKYIDIPIQHISKKLLRAMRREGGPDEIRELIERLRRYVPWVSLRTSVIVGYPGETEKDFLDLLDFVCEAKFEHLGAFIYSPEEGTAAYDAQDRVAVRIAEDRMRELMDVQREISRDINRQKVGRMLTVLVEGVSEESEHLLVARHEGQAPDVDGVVYINEGSAAPGEFAVAEITEAHEYDLIGRIV